MGATNRVLPVKTRWSASAVKKLRGERTKEEFAALIGASVDQIDSWENGTNPDLIYAERLTDLARSEPERYRDWKLAGSITIVCDDLEAAIERIRNEEQQAFERRKRFILEGE
jgi:hypothetical protein